MQEFNIEKTILCPAGCHLNEELKTAYQAAPDKIIPLCWVNANEGQEAYDMLEHYLRDENFAGVKMQPLFDAFTAEFHCRGRSVCWQSGIRMYRLL